MDFNREHASLTASADYRIRWLLSHINVIDNIDVDNSHYLSEQRALMTQVLSLRVLYAAMSDD